MESWLVLARGVSAMAARQRKFAVATLGDMSETMDGYRPFAEPQSVIARQVEFTRKATEATVAATRDIADVIGKSGADVASLVQQRVGAQEAAWLSDPARSAGLVELIASKLPPTLAAVDKSGLPSLVGERLRTQMQEIELLPLTTGQLSAMVKEGRHQQILDGLLDAVEKLVSNSDAMEPVRERILAKLPALFNLYRGEPVIMNKVVDATKALIAEIRADSAHPMRTELDLYLTALIERLESSPDFASRVDAFKHDLLARPELADLAARVWENFREFIERDVKRENSLIRRQLGAILANMEAQ